MNHTKLKANFTILFFFLSLTAAIAQVAWKGKITDQQNKPIEFASITYKENSKITFSKANGTFSLTLNEKEDNITLKIAFVGMRTLDVVFTKSNLPLEPTFKMQELTLTLNEVTVSSGFRDSKNSNSSIVIDQQAIEAVQAFSLLDVLNTLPGKSASAPNLNALQQLTLRGGFGNVARNGASATMGNEFDMNNSLGVAIIMDGITLSNDANMQGRSASKYGLAGSTINSASFQSGSSGNIAGSAYDVPFQGIDLRDIPTNTMEKIEIIQGVASAKYTELTDGAVIIDRKAGESPYVASIDINGGSTNLSLSKGFSLGSNLGALNIGTNYAIANADPRDKVKSYSRINQSLMWTNAFGDLRNTLSFDYNRRIDNRKMDPDADDGLMSKFSNQGFRVANRSNLELKNSFFNNLSLNLNYSQSKQNSYSQRQLNTIIKPVAYKDTIGIYEGYFIPGQYMAIEEIVGNPITGGLTLAAQARAEGLGLHHDFDVGANFSYSNNGGQGIIADPEQPRWPGSSNSNERPYDYEAIPGILNFDFYVTDNITAKLFNRTFKANIGLRQDIQNGYGTLQPRINLSHNLSEAFSVTASFGLSTKSPTLGHLYPAPVYLDIPLILNNTGSLSNSLYLVYTDKIIPDNSKLKPSKSTQFELGLQYKGGFLSSSFYAYRKNNKDGFTAKTNFKSYDLPEYAYSFDSSTQQYSYWQTGGTTRFNGATNYQVVNGTQSEVYGAEWTINTGKIKALQTSFSMSNSFSYGNFQHNYDHIIAIANGYKFSDDRIMTHSIYQPQQYKTIDLMTKLGATTHIPKIGFFISVNADLFLKKENRKIADGQLPIAYMIDASERIEMETFDASNPIYGNLKLKSSDELVDKQRMVYTNINVAVSKEIRKSFRISITGYNFFNIRPETYVQTASGTRTEYKYNSAPSLTATATLKF